MKKLLIGLTLLALPAVTLAQIGGSPPGGNYSLTGVAQALANAAWIVFTAVAVIMFVVAGILFLTAQGNPEKVQLARNAFLWGVAGVVVGIIAFSIITIVQSVIH